MNKDNQIKDSEVEIIILMIQEDMIRGNKEIHGENMIKRDIMIQKGHNIIVMGLEVEAIIIIWIIQERWTKLIE